MASIEEPFIIERGKNVDEFPGTHSFVDLLRSLANRALNRPTGSVQGCGGLTPTSHELEAAERLFDWKGGNDIFVTRAPGRLDVMGGIADYSGSLVLQLPLAEACHVALQRQACVPDGTEPMLRIVSLGSEAGHRSCCFEMPLKLLGTAEQPLDLQDARALLTQDPATFWAAYVAGAVLLLAHEVPASSPLVGGAGLAILVQSSVPEGKGVSSSAAIEVAAMLALAAAYGAGRLASDGVRLALACQRVENRVVGAPCGVMDQMASALGRRGGLMALLCQPCHFQGIVEVPAHVRLFGIDSGERHSVSGSDYGAVRAGAFMGLKLVRHACGTEGSPELEYLAQVSPARWNAGLAAACPAAMTGAEFLRAHGAHIDDATALAPDTCYAVRVPAAHPVREHDRVCEFARLLAGPPSPAQLERLGDLMFASHASYGACGLGSPGTDRIVELVRGERRAAARKGRAPVLHGAKITGGGSGGVVCVLASAGPEGEAAVARVAARYEAERLAPGAEAGEQGGFVEPESPGEPSVEEPGARGGESGGSLGVESGRAARAGMGQADTTASKSSSSHPPRRNQTCSLFSGSSDGALKFGAMRLTVTRPTATQ